MQKDDSSDLCLPSREISYPFTIHYYTAILHNTVDVHTQRSKRECNAVDYALFGS